MYLDLLTYYKAEKNNQDVHFAIVPEGDEDLALLCEGQTDPHELWYGNPVYYCIGPRVHSFGWMLDDNIMYCLSIGRLQYYDDVVSGVRRLFPKITIHDCLMAQLQMLEL